MFKEFKKFLLSSFTSALVKVIENFWKLWELIDGLNKLRSQIASGMGKRQMSQWVPYNFKTLLKKIHCTNHIFKEAVAIGIGDE